VKKMATSHWVFFFIAGQESIPLHFSLPLTCVYVFSNKIQAHQGIMDFGGLSRYK
jgi:hypothetical protein